MSCPLLGWEKTWGSDEERAGGATRQSPWATVMGCMAGLPRLQQLTLLPQLEVRGGGREGGAREGREVLRLLACAWASKQAKERACLCVCVRACVAHMENVCVCSFCWAKYHHHLRAPRPSRPRAPPAARAPPTRSCARWPRS